jgi:hypothetical protein
MLWMSAPLLQCLRGLTTTELMMCSSKVSLSDGSVLSLSSLPQGLKAVRAADLCRGYVWGTLLQCTALAPFDSSSPSCCRHMEWMFRTRRCGR